MRLHKIIKVLKFSPRLKRLCYNLFPGVCHSRESGNPDEFQGFCLSLIDKIVIITQPLQSWVKSQYGINRFNGFY
jgi:hypothetical protein